MILNELQKAGTKERNFAHPIRQKFKASADQAGIFIKTKGNSTVDATMITKTTISTTIISDDQVPQRIDWPRIVTNLHNRNSLPKLARKLNCDDETLKRLKKSTTIEPRFALGLSLLALHGTECRNEHIAMGLGSEEEI